ncbi:MAG: lipocalin-like domain-containing protein [Candidatus Binatia bacterium]
MGQKRFAVRQHQMIGPEKTCNATTLSLRAQRSNLCLKMRLLRRLGLLAVTFCTASSFLAGMTPRFFVGKNSPFRAVEISSAYAGEDTLPTSWRNAQAGYQFSFPQDHAAHPEYRIEWWYYTGNVETRNGRRFGYQLTFFRTGMIPTPTTPSRWAVRDLYMAHFAISDIDGQRFHTFERLNRAGINWAGADTATYHVWNDSWEVRLQGDTHILTAQNQGFRLDLRLTPEKPPVIHGEHGISQKGAVAGNASHYYSYTRLRTTGTLVVDNQPFEVTGTSWMDHEFGSTFLEQEQVGWDWFSLQLEDGRELMLFQIRRGGGAMDPYSSGTLIDADGHPTHLQAETFTLTPKQWWRSQASGARYPINWEISLPQQDMTLQVSANLQNQELQTGESTRVTYWEGSVSVTGNTKTGAVNGRGYLEMTGYTGPGMGAIFSRQ